jgi:hypothetical protein
MNEHDADGTGTDGEREPGRMRFQDGSTTPREPSLAERRAREQVLRRQAAYERQQAEDAERRSTRKRNRVLVGAGVTVGVVALIAVGYAAAQPEATQTALCIDEETDEVVDDANCVTPAASGTSGGFYPIFIGTGGRQYHYNYGGTGTVGQRVTGGTTVVPAGGTRVTTPSGRDVSPRASSSGVSRGGLGVSGGGSSSGS